MSVDGTGALLRTARGVVYRSTDGATWTTLTQAGLPAVNFFFSPVIADAAPGVYYLPAGRLGLFTLGR